MEAMRETEKEQWERWKQSPKRGTAEGQWEEPYSSEGMANGPNSTKQHLPSWKPILPMRFIESARVQSLESLTHPSSLLSTFKALRSSFYSLISIPFSLSPVSYTSLNTPS